MPVLEPTGLFSGLRVGCFDLPFIAPAPYPSIFLASSISMIGMPERIG